jgi:hypothetical protein
MINFRIRMDLQGEDNQAIEIEARQYGSPRATIEIEIRDRDMVQDLRLSPRQARLVADAIREALSHIQESTP